VNRQAYLRRPAQQQQQQQQRTRAGL